MTSSKQVARVVGPILVAVTLSEILNPSVWVGVSAPTVYQAGLLAFVAGVFIVRAHNVWTLRWPILLTLLGWTAIVFGLARMFLTGIAQRSAGDPATAFGLELALLAIGAFVTFKAYVGND